MTRPSGETCSSAGVDLRHPDAVGVLDHGAEPVGRRLVRAEHAERSALSRATSRSQPPITRVASLEPVAGARDVDGVVAEVRQAQVAQQQAAVGVRVGAHPALALGRERDDLRARTAVLVEQLLGAGRSASRLRARRRARRRRPARPAAPGASGRALAGPRPGPALRRAQHDHRPARPLGAPASRVAGCSRISATISSSAVGHRLVHGLGLVALDEPRRGARSRSAARRARRARSGSAPSDWRSCSR